MIVHYSDFYVVNIIVNITQLTAHYQALCALWGSKPVAFWKDYLKWNLLDPLIGHLGLFWLCIRSLLATYWVSFGYVLARLLEGLPQVELAWTHSSGP